MNDRKRLRDLLAERSLIIKDVILSNGQRSRYFFDCKRVTLSSEGAPLVAEAFLHVIEQLPVQPVALGGETAGADPILGAVMMAALARNRRYDTF